MTTDVLTSGVAAWAEKLDAMTPDEIAAVLRRENVTGVRSSASRCPIAVFLRGKANVRDIMVMGSFIEWEEIVRTLGMPLVRNRRVSTPNGGVRDFVSLFDSDRYADLETSPAHATV